jgi:hypothetical protein
VTHASPLLSQLNTGIQEGAGPVGERGKAGEARGDVPSWDVNLSKPISREWEEYRGAGLGRVEMQKALALGTNLTQRILVMVRQVRTRPASIINPLLHDEARDNHDNEVE